MSRSIRFVPMCHLADGSEFGLHIHELVGAAGDGPTVGISGAIHGNEVAGTYVIRELARVLENLAFKGRILLLPVANPHGFAENERFTTIDRVNLNRVFPGNPQGTFASQLAHMITSEFFAGLDAMIDLHTGTDRPTVDYVYLLNDEGLARSAGAKILYRPKQDLVGTSCHVTIQKGIQSVVIELGGGTVDQEPYVKRGVNAVLNMLRHLQMLEGEPDPLPDQIVLEDIQLVFPTQGGILETEAPALGERVQGGDVLGRVISPYTFEELEVLRCPVEDGIMILSHLVRNVVHPGDYAYMVGDLNSQATL